jgi:hypothetical protein
MSTKIVERSKEAQAVIDTLKASGKDMTLAEIATACGLDIKTGHLASGKKAGLIEVAGEREVKVTVTKKVHTYRYVAPKAN